MGAGEASRAEPRYRASHRRMRVKLVVAGGLRFQLRGRVEGAGRCAHTRATLHTFGSERRRRRRGCCLGWCCSFGIWV